MIKRVLTLVAAMHITASVFINDDESGLHPLPPPAVKLAAKDALPCAKVEQVTMDNASAGTMRRRYNQPAHAGKRLLERQTLAGPKMGKVLGPYSFAVYGIHPTRDPA